MIFGRNEFSSDEFISDELSRFLQTTVQTFGTHTQDPIWRPLEKTRSKNSTFESPRREMPRLLLSGGPRPSWDVPGLFWDVPGQSWDVPGQSWDDPGQSWDVPGLFRS